MPRVCPKCYGEMEAFFINEMFDDSCLFRFECPNGHRIFERVSTAVKIGADSTTKELVCPRCNDVAPRLHLSPMDSLVCIKCIEAINEELTSKQHMQSIVSEGR